jgi:hypothetical protein
MLPDDGERLGELAEDDFLGLDPVAQLQAFVVHRDRHRDGRTLRCRQDRRQNRRADRIAAPGDIEREFRSEFPDARGSGALPLRPQQPQRHTWRNVRFRHVVLPSNSQGPDGTAWKKLSRGVLAGSPTTKIPPYG